MNKIAALAIVLGALAPDLAWAQDIAGIEDCTRTSGLDKRTGCFQSNVDYLQKVIARNAAEAQQKLNAARNEIAALQKAIADLHARLAEIESAAKKPETKTPDAKTPETKTPDAKTPDAKTP